MAETSQSLSSLNASYKTKHSRTRNYPLPQPPTLQPRQSDLPPRYTETHVMSAYPQPMYPFPPSVQQQQPQPQGGQLQQQQQQSTNVVVIGGQQPPPAIVQERRRPSISFTCAIVFSCFVIWICCGSICGLVAFVLALYGKNTVETGEESGARKMLLRSYGLSVAGVITGVILIIVLIAVLINSNRHDDNKKVCSTTCYYGYRYDSFQCKVCCSSMYDSSGSKPDCRPVGFYYSSGKKYCCPYMD